MVDIVQSVERQIVDLVVVGSSPSIHPINKVALNRVIFVFYAKFYSYGQMEMLTYFIYNFSCIIFIVVILLF